MLKDIVLSNKTYAKMTVSDESVLDEIAVKVVKQDAPDFLLPVKMINIDGLMEIRYEIGDGIRLSYMDERMSKKDFLTLLENMIRPFKNCNDWFLDYHHFYLNPDYIIAGKNCMDVRYVYRFDQDYMQDEQSILAFFGEFILKINLIDDPEYILNLYRRTKEKSATLMMLLDYVVQENVSGKEYSLEEKTHRKEKKLTMSVSEIKESISSSLESKKAEIKGEIKPEVKEFEKPAYKAASEFGKEDVKGDLINHLFGEESEEKPKKKGKKDKEKKEKSVSSEKSNKGLLGGLFGAKKAASDKNAGNSADERNSVQNIYEEKNQQVRSSNLGEMENFYMPDATIGDETVIESVEIRESSGDKLVLQLEDDHGFHCPKYIEIDLHRGYATIGRYDKAGNAQADYNFDASLSFISRRHCRIEKKNGQIMIIDLGSGNGTLVNEVALAANMPWPIHSGDKIVFSKNNKITYRVC